MYLKVKGAEKLKKMLSSADLKKAVKMALNDSAKNAKVAGSKKIRDKFAIKAGDLNRHLTISKAATINDATIFIRAASKPFGFAYFGAKNVKKGVSVKVRKTGKRRVIPGVFMATVVAGKTDSHLGVFRRVGKSRLPIFEKKVITAASMFAQSGPQVSTIKTAVIKFAERFQHHFSRIKK